MSELRRLFTYVTPHWPRLAGALIGLTLSSLITLALPYAVRLLVDSVFVQRDFAALNRIGLGLLGLNLVQAVVSFSYRYWLQYTAQRSITDLRLAIQRHLLSLPLDFYANRRTGDLVSRVSNDVTTLQGALVDAPINLIRQVLTVGGGLGIMFWSNWRLTLLILALIPPLLLVANFYGKRLKRLATVVQDRQAEALVVLEEMLSGMRVVKSFGREPYEMQRYAKALEASFAVANESTRQRAIFVPLISLLGFAAIVILIWVGGRQVIAGTMTPGELIAYLFYMIFISGPLAEVASLWGRLQEAAGASRRVFEILDTAGETSPQAHSAQTGRHEGPIEGAPRPHFIPSQTRGTRRGHVRFVDVSFHYQAPDGEALRSVLYAIDIDAQPGQVIALVGYSGAGKTTLVNLLPRFYEPTHGHIELDGQDIRHLPLAELRRQIGLVPQETFLFGGTVRENIAYGRIEASDTAIQAAAQAAYAHDFIRELPHGYETIVGERGIKLSAGQRQRIAIARALLKDPRILILDEATSALDTESERWVQAALERLMAGRTAFVIAHRLSTIQRADCILVLERGRIVERGTHAEMVTRGGVYQRLYALQFSEADPAHTIDMIPRPQ